MSDPPKDLLQALGLLTYRWAAIEAVIEMACAYLYKYEIGKTKDGKPPKPFKSRIGYIRQALKHPLFVHIRQDVEARLDTTIALSNERNDRIHGVFTHTSSADDALQTYLKSHDKGYVAVQDVSASTTELRKLAEKIFLLFVGLFNEMERLKVLLSALHGDPTLGCRIRFDG